MTTRKKLDLDKIARGLGGRRRGKIKARGGYFGALQSAAERPEPIRGKLKLGWMIDDAGGTPVLTPPDGEKAEDLTCPRCRSGDIGMGYTCPPVYWCNTCGARLRDANHLSIPVYSKEVGERLRPSLYGKPQCHCCSHAPHPEGPCEFCEADKHPPPVILILEPLR